MADKLQEGIEAFLELFNDHPNHKAKARFIAKWVRLYYKERKLKRSAKTPASAGA